MQVHFYDMANNREKVLEREFDTMADVNQFIDFCCKYGVIMEGERCDFDIEYDIDLGVISFYIG